MVSLYSLLVKLTLEISLFLLTLRVCACLFGSAVFALGVTGVVLEDPEGGLLNLVAEVRCLEVLPLC